jgi:hypothetical protein
VGAPHLRGGQLHGRGAQGGAVDLPRSIGRVARLRAI